ncbi:hypothetical protein [Spirillospora sp. NBC_01491]|uniref:hypothetical protein n=1 Tax=Spirillospora sp. NBC_01491 TaxID=2976007 RepID=UPI002E356491|nr:hypothetical protein [Spirillospora sp. NBC_01491]
MRTRSLIAAAPVVTGLVTFIPATASAAPTNITPDATLTSTHTSSTPSNILLGGTIREPGMEYGGDIYIKGKSYGIVYFDDYAGNKDRDLFYVYDSPGDGASVTLRVCYSHTCKTKRASYGRMEKIDVGNIGNGYKV